MNDYAIDTDDRFAGTDCALAEEAELEHVDFVDSEFFAAEDDSDFEEFDLDLDSFDTSGGT